MGIFKRLFGNNKNGKYNSSSEEKYKESRGLSINMSLDNDSNVSLSSSPVGEITDSKYKDFYVYEWFIKSTGEVFYVGKGRGKRYNMFHSRAYEAEKIRELYDTDVRLVYTDLTEEQAITLESDVITQILNTTNDRLTNRIIPFFTKRGNGYDRSPSTPKLEFEKAPYLYASEIENHYYGTKARKFDIVEDEDLRNIVFITGYLGNEITNIYGGNPNKYREELERLLAINKTKILSTQYAKSVTAWIYIGDDYVSNYEEDQEKALERIGRNIPTYHLLDVRQFLFEKYGDIDLTPPSKESVNPIHNRTALESIRNLNNSQKGYAEGMPYWEQGDEERRAGNIDEAINLFDKARYNGYDAPALYRSYAMAFRKNKDYDNEISIIDEAIERLGLENMNVMKLKERQKKSYILKSKE